jgi:hypothetical protein
MVCSDTPCFFDAAATLVASDSRRMRTICSPVNRLFFMALPFVKGRQKGILLNRQLGQIFRGRSVVHSIGFHVTSNPLR